ncbi:MAG: glycosyltransferase [Candidatus Aenigmarchaeota archaeon]|nr:glycosyltransferase [Candidatus Aenigmarchaeota archaeon]
MNLAIAHDFLFTKGGSERVVLSLAKNFKAPIYTTVYIPERTYPGFRKLKVFSYPTKLLKSPLLQTNALFKFRSMNLSQYDIIISSGNWAKHVGIKETNHPQIHYEHTPVRVFYDLCGNMKNCLSFIPRQIFKLWVWYTKKLDLEATKRIDKIVTNSQNTRKRIKKFYGRDAEIIYPPVDIKKFKYKKSEDYFLSVQRIEPEKRIEIQIEIFRRLPYENLLIVGASSKNAIPYFEKMKKIAPKNVKFLGSVSDKKLIELYARCKAVIQTNIDEDFGLIPIETMASGKPCLAANEGGFRESIIHGKTGLLINKPYIENFVKLIRNFDKYKFDPKECRKRVKFFSEENFIKRIEEVISEVLENKHKY